MPVGLAEDRRWGFRGTQLAQSVKPGFHMGSSPILDIEEEKEEEKRRKRKKRRRKKGKRKRRAFR